MTKEIWNMNGTGDEQEINLISWNMTQGMFHRHVLSWSMDENGTVLCVISTMLSLNNDFVCVKHFKLTDVVF